MYLLEKDKEEIERQREEWFKLYSAGGITIANACKKLGMLPRTVQRWKEQDLEFHGRCNAVQLRNSQVWCSTHGRKLGETGPGLEKRKREIIAKNVAIATKKRKKIQALWLKTYAESLFNVGEVCVKCGVTRQRHWLWTKDDEEFIK